MKKKQLIPLLFITFILLLQQLNGYAQDIGKWSEPSPHPCFHGIRVSVINMGQGSGPNDYLWGVKFINMYTTGVKFKYTMNIGEKITSVTGGDIATLKKKGDKDDTFTREDDKLRARLFHTPSEEWYVYIWDVCFDNMRCGQSDQCFADCDRDNDPDNPKPNQLCGLSASPSLNAPESNNAPKEMRGTLSKQIPLFDETTNWQREDKQVEIIIGKTKEGIYWKRKNDKQYTFFQKLPNGTYRYETGTDFYILKFESDTKVGFWKNGTLENYYNLITKTPTDDGTSKVKNGIWINNGAKATITVSANGLVLHAINSVDDGSPFYKRISAIEYRKDDPDGIHFCTLRLKEDNKLHSTCDDKYSFGEYSFLSDSAASADPNKISAKRLNGVWKTDIDRHTTLTLRAITDDSIASHHVVVVGFTVSGSEVYTRASGNVFTNRKKNWATCFRSEITYMTDDKFYYRVWKCSGALVNEGEWYRVGK